MFFLTVPTDAEVLRLLERRAASPFTYQAVGVTRSALVRAPAGFVLDRYGAALGEGQHVFERARRALSTIRNYPPSFTRIVRLHPDVTLREGSVFGTVAEHFGFHSVHPCRVIYVVDEATRYGFGFGTLPGHAEAGEESFSVRIDGDGQVHYEVQAFSRPHDALTRLGAPVARGLQRRFQRETVATMKAACA